MHQAQAITSATPLAGRAEGKHAGCVSMGGASVRFDFILDNGTQEPFLRRWYGLKHKSSGYTKPVGVVGCTFC
jgi:hypothetical protein